MNSLKRSSTSNQHRRLISPKHTSRVQVVSNSQHYILPQSNSQYSEHVVFDQQPYIAEQIITTSTPRTHKLKTTSVHNQQYYPLRSNNNSNIQKSLSNRVNKVTSSYQSPTSGKKQRIVITGQQNQRDIIYVPEKIYTQRQYIQPSQQILKTEYKRHSNQLPPQSPNSKVHQINKVTYKASEPKNYRDNSNGMSQIIQQYSAYTSNYDDLPTSPVNQLIGSTEKYQPEEKQNFYYYPQEKTTKPVVYRTDNIGSKIISNSYQTSHKVINIPILHISPSDVYQGQYNQQDQYHGYGTYYFKQCNVIYQGEFFNGTINGRGKLFYEQSPPNTYQLIYEGFWKNSHKFGEGKYFYGQQKHFYNGNWQNDLKQGYGIYECVQFRYEGTWLKNKKHGQGVLQDRFRNRFEGSFYNDNFMNGTIKYSNGDVYKGEYQTGRKQGQGQYYYSSQNIKYMGQFINNERHGRGHLIYSNGNQFIGFFKHGRIDQSMNCTFKWANNDQVFNGWFKNGQPQKGTVKNNRTGEQYEITGEWE